MRVTEPDQPKDFATAIETAEADGQEAELLRTLGNMERWLPAPVRYRILDHLNAVASDLYGDAFEERNS